jgi:threonine synthase
MRQELMGEWVMNDEAGLATKECYKEDILLCPQGDAAKRGMDKLLDSDETLSRNPNLFTMTADACKFPGFIRDTLGIEPPLPDKYKDIYERPERVYTMKPDIKKLQELIYDIMGI